MKPGLYRDVPRSVYENWQAVRHSTLRLFNKSAAHAREEILHPPKPTSAMDFGSAVHAALLEPARYIEEYAVAPSQQQDKGGAWVPLDRRTKMGKTIWSEFEAANRGKSIITRSEFEKIKRMQERAYSHPIAKQLLGGRGPTEASFYWEDPLTDAPCKARLDKLTDALPSDGLFGGPTIVDVKTAESAFVRDFERAIERFSYHQQAAFYLDGANVIAPMPRKFVLIVFETDAPYELAVYQMEEAAIEQGRDEYRRNLKLYAECLKSGEWPGYPEELRTVGLPYWAYKGTSLE